MSTKTQGDNKTPTKLATTSYAAALRMALHDAMAADERVFIYGEDVGGEFGGAFKITKGLPQAFPNRVINSPISEDAIAGFAVGAALDGMRPVVEFQFADFATIAFNQLVNHAATSYWRTGRPCPLVARLPVGGTPGGGPFHSQMAEAWFGHHPGLAVLAPATVDDAYTLLRQAIEHDDPIVFCEHKLLYESVRVPEFTPTMGDVHPGTPMIRRAGRDCTIVCWSAMVHEAMAAADALARDSGIEAEVLDLRCLRPLHNDAILASVSRTGRVVIASEDFPFAGLAAEVAALVSERGFGLLDAPPRRVCALDTPIPYHPDLWRAHRPNADAIAQAVLATVRF